MVTYTAYTHTHNPCKYLKSEVGKLVPMVNVSYYCMGASLSMRFLKILVDPHNKMVLKRPFDDLVE